MEGGEALGFRQGLDEGPGLKAPHVEQGESLLPVE